MAPPRAGTVELEALLGERVVAVTDLTRPWATAFRTEAVTLAGGNEVVVQRAAGGDASRAAVGRRIRLGRALPDLAPWLPLPEVLGGSARATVPFVVTRFVPGTPGDELLDDDARATLLGRLAGELARDVARVPTRGLRLPRTWADPDRLAATARGWLAGVSAALGAGVAGRVETLIAHVPDLLDDEPPVFAHGDLAPVNLVVRDAAVAGLLDLERARLAHPLFDAAWWRLIVRHHHPDRWDSVGSAFFGALGSDGQARAAVARLDALAALACLEMVHLAPVRSAARAAWAMRLASVLAPG